MSDTLTRTAADTTVPVAGTYEIDPSHSSASFQVRHLGLSKVRGGFERFAGTVVIGEDPLQSSVSVDLESASFTTGAEDRDTVASASSILRREEIESLPAEDLAALIGHLPGLTVLLDGAGNRPMVTARGFFGGGEAEYVQLLVDGVPAGDAESGLVDWTFLPAEAIERIEYLRGPASALYGDTALGGVIEVFTRAATSPMSGALTIDAGSFDTGKGTIFWRRRGEIEGGVAANNWTTSGYRDQSSG